MTELERTRSTHPRPVHRSGAACSVIRGLIPLLLAVACQTPALAQNAADTTTRPRLRDLGVVLGNYETGKHNAITDVAGVTVGHVTLSRGQNIRTGVTAIVPHAGNLYQERVPGVIYIGNGYGKLVGYTQVHEFGQIETPILLTNTLSVWDVALGVVDYMQSYPANAKVTINPVVGETNDSRLNDLIGRHVTKEHAIEAIKSAKSGPVAEGSVGAGTGTVNFGWKGGIGTSSRVLPAKAGGYAVGVLVQTNHGGVLQIAGAPVGEKLDEKYQYRQDFDQDYRNLIRSTQTPKPKVGPKGDDGSCMIVLATNAPLNGRQLMRLAARATLALGKTGSSMHHTSGDYVIAFSTATSVRIPFKSKIVRNVERLHEDDMGPLFRATVDATEEALINSLLRATTVTGAGGRVVEAIPIDDVKAILKRR